MKIILSRKGFDSENGRCPSPIFEDNSFLSFPIPESSALLTFSEIGRDQEMAVMVQELTRRRRRPLSGSDHVHLDPDLNWYSLARKPGWRPLFGQALTAQRHLDKHAIGPGDIFLFFGWFRRVEVRDGRVRYVPGSPDLHVLFGWLRVGEVWRLPEDAFRIPDWAAEHPHVTADPANKNYRFNTIYVAAGDGTTYDAGTFRSCVDQLVLSNPDQSLRSRWRIPKWFHPEMRQTALSYHRQLSRWNLDQKHAYLHSVAKGQEFVLDSCDYPEAVDWAERLIADNGA